MPELFVRGTATCSANLNPENPVGTVQSIEHVLRSLERHVENDREQIERLESPDAQPQAAESFVARVVAERSTATLQR